MTPEEFRSAGHLLIDWIAELRAGVPHLPVLADVDPGDIRARFAELPPESTMGMAQLLDVLTEDVVPGVTQVQHPMHFGWFPSNASLASVLGDIASSGIGSLGISWESSPALTEVEEVVCDWMRQLVGLDDGWSGTIQDTASTACLVALLVARERTSNLVQNRGGLQSLDSPLVVYASEQAHSSVAKAALLAGFGWDNLRSIPVDPVLRSMRPDALAAGITADLEAGKRPTAIVATIGTTATTAIDPLAEIVAIAKEHGIFVHVAAAVAGSAMLLEEYRPLWDGVEEADSVTWNPHKWMGTILDTSLFYVRDPHLLTQVMSTNPSYLRSSADGSATQFRDWGIPLGRRFRALKVLFHLQLDGIEAIRERLRRDIANARWLAGKVEAAVDWELVAPVTLQTVCVRHRPPGLDPESLDEHTIRWVSEINRSGVSYLTASQLADGWIARVSIGAEATERSHVERLWSIMSRVVAGGPVELAPASG